jgi:hypothetical protein
MVESLRHRVLRIDRVEEGPEMMMRTWRILLMMRVRMPVATEGRVLLGMMNTRGCYYKAGLRS